MDIHNRIKILRLLRGLTQEELAFRAEVPRPSLGNYEQGTYVPRDKSLESLAGIFGVEPGYLRYGSPVVGGQAWQPAIPANARRKLETINDIVKLLPEFITENCFDAVISRQLDEGGRLFFFGRDNKYSCLLLAVADLAEPVLNLINDIVPVKDLLEHLDITVESFSAKELDLQAKHSGHKGCSFDVDGMSRSLTRLKGPAVEISKEPLSFVIDALLYVDRDYDIPIDAVPSLRGYLIQRYLEEAPLPANRLNATRLMSDIRRKIEALGGIRRK